jgi:lipoprotein NlpI
MGEHDTPELRSNAQVLDRGWPWPVVGFYLGEVTPEDLRAATLGPESEDTTRRKCDVAFFLAEYDLLHRRRSEAAKLMEEAAKTCTFDRLIRRSAIAEAERIRQ